MTLFWDVFHGTVRALRWLTIGSAVALIVYFLYLFQLNAFGPSTRYISPRFGNAEARPDGRMTLYTGEEFWIVMDIIRHKVNGTCTFPVRRYAEVVGGPRHGWRYLISTATLFFVGTEARHEVRWPVPSDKYILGMGYEVLEPGPAPYIGWPEFEQERRQHMKLRVPLLPEGVKEREFTFYVVGRYFCNDLDWYIPRYIQGGDRPNITPRINGIVTRKQ